MSLAFSFLFWLSSFCIFFFFNDTATTEIYTLSLHDALPICKGVGVTGQDWDKTFGITGASGITVPDRKSTRLNSSHDQISYAVFCLKKKKPSDIAEGGPQVRDTLQGRTERYAIGRARWYLAD